MFKGSIPALITPFKDGEIDWPAFDQFVEWQIEQGSHALVPTGTTGESPTLTHDEHNAIVERCVQIVKRRVPVIAGTGSNSTREAIELTRHARDVGADAALVIAPYYNKPTQEGMIAHFTAIHDEADLPIILYNVPGRCVVDIKNETIATLAKLPNIVGLKDATDDLSRPKALREMIGEDFCLLSGEDASIGSYLKQGGDGIISVVANIAPAQSSKLHNAWQSGDLETFEDMCALLLPLGRDLFCEPSPTPVKYAASVLGLCENELRLPLVQATAEARTKIDAAMAHAGLNAGSASTIKAHG